MDLLFEFPSEEDLNYWRKIKINTSPLVIKDTKFYPDAPKENYINLGFVEVEINTYHKWTRFLPNNIQAQRKNMS